nr:ArlX4 [Gefionella okellyi]
MGAFATSGTGTTPEDFQSLFNVRLKHRDKLILLLGVERLGKTKFMTYMFPNAETFLPTIGFVTTSSPDLHSLRLVEWTMSSGDKLGALYHHYYQNTAAVVWMIDATRDEDDFEESATQFHRMVSAPLLANAVILVLVDKLEMARATVVNRLVANHGFNDLKQTWFMQSVDMRTLRGVREGFNWMIQQVVERDGQ